MASTDNRPAFRLPWQSANGTPSDGDAAGTAVAEAPAWPSHDLARRQSRGTAAPTADTGSAGTDAATEPRADATTVTDATTESGQPGEPATPAATTPDAQAPAATRSDMTELATPAAPEATDRARKPTKFLADLTRAMRQAADEARQSALAQFQADVERHTADARGTCDAAAADARRRADEDITSLGEWETAEIARVRRETEEGITARHGRLEAELAAQAAQLEAEIARVNARVEAFAAQMETFFQGLQKEEDPARFAAMAEQLPEPPAFDAWTVPAETHVEPSPLEIWTSAADASDAAATGAEAAGATAAPADDHAGDHAGMPAMQQSDFAAAEAEAAAWSAEEETAEPAPAAETETETETHTVEATADAETTADAPAEPSATTEATPTQDWPTPATPARLVTVRTQVAVVGLVSVASIATFKRMLGRVQGVHGVQVSSGPDGEFLFNVTHDESLDMPKAVASVQGFEVEILESGPGIVSCKATDPEVV